MEQIIQHVRTFLDKIFEIRIARITDLDAAASVIAEDSRELSRNILQVFIEEINLGLREDKAARKTLGLVMQEKDRERKLLTELGEIRFDRDYYYNKQSGKYEYPLDKMLSIQPRSRIGETISAKLVAKATEESYARSTEEVTGGTVSRQTVRNQILKAPALEKSTEGEKKSRKILEIYADEDHVHLQKPGKERGKKSKAVPLVTVTEGKNRVSKGRNKTINPMHFVDEKMDSKELWASVEGYIDKAYETEEIEEIRIHGDGGRWIKNGLENLANVEHVLDGYHLQKYLKAMDRMFSGHNIRSRINKGLGENNRDRVEAIIGDLISKCRDRKEYEKVEEFKTYLFSNWEAAVNRNREGMTGSCTEGQVSHILSERFSRNPMGWSEEGLGKLSKLRVYCKNGGEIKAEHFRKERKSSESYKEYAKRYLEEQKKGINTDWMNDLTERYVYNTASGTQQAIKNLGRIRTDHLC